MITEYKLLSGQTVEALEAAVASKIALGFQPLGCAFIHHEGASHRYGPFYQTVVKYA